MKPPRAKYIPDERKKSLESFSNKQGLKQKKNGAKIGPKDLNPFSNPSCAGLVWQNKD
jgi:hypothetical protein